MKKILLTAIAALFALTVFSQVKIGLKGGFASNTIETNEVMLDQENTLSLLDVSGGVHFGLFSQIKMNKFFIQPEVLFNSNTADYTLSTLNAGEIIRDRYNYLDVPVMMGYKAGSLRLGAGPVGHVYLNDKSELLKMEGFKNTFEKMTFGYQAGIGLDLWKLVIDVKYEGNFSDFDSFINFNDQNVNLADAPSRWIVSFGYAF